MEDHIKKLNVLFYHEKGKPEPQKEKKGKNRWKAEFPKYFPLYFTEQGTQSQAFR